jgi:hypothetical protein
MKSFIAGLAIIICHFNAGAQNDVSYKYVKEFTEGYESHRLENLVERTLWFLQFNPFEHPTVRGWFPIHQNNEDRVIFWENTVSPSVYATFTFNKNYAESRFDTTKRELNAFELGVLDMVYQASEDLKRNSLYKHLANTKVVLIPITTEYGNKVFCMTRAKEPDVFIIGNDIEFEFDSQYRLTARKVVHHTATVNCVEPEIDIDSAKLVGFHHHYGEKVQGISSIDIASVFYYADKSNWGLFHIGDSNTMYSFGFPQMHIFEWTSEQLQSIKKSVNTISKRITILE